MCEILLRLDALISHHVRHVAPIRFIWADDAGDRKRKYMQDPLFFRTFTSEESVCYLSVAARCAFIAIHQKETTWKTGTII